MSSTLDVTYSLQKIAGDSFIQQILFWAPTICQLPCSVQETYGLLKTDKKLHSINGVSCEDRQLNPQIGFRKSRNKRSRCWLSIQSSGTLTNQADKSREDQLLRKVSGPLRPGGSLPGSHRSQQLQGEQPNSPRFQGKSVMRIADLRMRCCYG